MPPLKFDPSGQGPAKVEYILPTKVENDKELADYLSYLKSIGTDMGSITAHDLVPFYFLMKIPQRFSLDLLKKVFGFLTTSVSLERFEKVEEAQDCIALIETYRTEISL